MIAEKIEISTTAKIINIVKSYESHGQGTKEVMSGVLEAEELHSTATLHRIIHTGKAFCPHPPEGFLASFN